MHPCICEAILQRFAGPVFAPGPKSRLGASLRCAFTRTILSYTDGFLIMVPNERRCFSSPPPLSSSLSEDSRPGIRDLKYFRRFRAPRKSISRNATILPFLYHREILTHLEHSLSLRNIICAYIRTIRPKITTVSMAPSCKCILPNRFLYQGYFYERNFVRICIVVHVKS